MNILLIDTTGNFLDFALRCQDYGHSVKWFIGDETCQRVGEGLVKKVPDWEPHMKWADLVVTSDNTKYIYHLEKYRKLGYPIFGPNLETTQWELDRAKGQEILEKNGIKVIPSVEFTDYNKAISYVKTNMKRYVSKPNGDAAKELSYVSKSPADMVFMLEYWKKNAKIKDKFILQEFHGGIEMAVGTWVGANGFCGWFLENFEHKKLMNDDKGVNTGEMGTALKYVRESKLADIVLKPIEAELIRQGYTGFIDVSVIIDKQGNVWPLEFTTRPGWPLFQIQQAVHKGDPAQWMLDLINGKDTFTPSEDVSVGVVVALPDFPYSKITKKDLFGYPVYGITDAIRKNIHPAEMALADAPFEENGTIVNKKMLVSAGSYLLVCTGTSSTIDEAREKAYKVVNKLEVPNSPMWRTDIAKRLEKQLDELQELGFATDWKY